MAEYCTQCGLQGRPIVAVGHDADGEPACVGHAVKGSDVARQPGTCTHGEFCTKPAGHRGRCNKARRGEQEAEIKPAPVSAAPKVYKPKPTKPKSQAQIAAEPVNVMTIPLTGGHLTLAYGGDMLKLFQSREDVAFLQALMRTIECRGKMMHPFANREKDTKTGKMVSVQVDEGFLDDMLSMSEPDEKATMLEMLWNKKEFS